jgi:hypothetical protein
MSKAFLIICDEFSQLAPSEWNRFKALITQKKGTVRKAWGYVHETYPHRASFCGTTNDREIINHIQSTRRLIIFNAKEIDYTSPIDYDEVNAEAMGLINSGKYRWWFNQKEIDCLLQRNEQFRALSYEEQSFYTLIGKPDNDHPGEEATAAEVLNYMARFSPVNFNPGSVVKVGRLLNKENFHVNKTNRGDVYLVVFKTPGQGGGGFFNF